MKNLYEFQDKIAAILRGIAAGGRLPKDLDLEAVCREHGAYCASPRGGGSHFKIGHPAMAEKLTVPFNRPIKPIHIRKR